MPFLSVLSVVLGMDRMISFWIEMVFVLCLVGLFEFASKVVFDTL